MLMAPAYKNDPIPPFIQNTKNYKYFPQKVESDIEIEPSNDIKDRRNKNQVRHGFYTRTVKWRNQELIKN